MQGHVLDSHRSLKMEAEREVGALVLGTGTAGVLSGSQTNPLKFLFTVKNVGREVEKEKHLQTALKI